MAIGNIYERLLLSKWNISRKYFYIHIETYRNPCLKSKTRKIISHSYLMSNVCGHYSFCVFASFVVCYSVFLFSLFYQASNIEPIHRLQYINFFLLLSSARSTLQLMHMRYLLHPRNPNVSFCTKTEIGRETWIRIIDFESKKKGNFNWPKYINDIDFIHA